MWYLDGFGNRKFAFCTIIVKESRIQHGSFKTDTKYSLYHRMYFELLSGNGGHWLRLVLINKCPYYCWCIINIFILKYWMFISAMVRIFSHNERWNCSIRRGSSQDLKLNGTFHRIRSVFEYVTYPLTVNRPNINPQVLAIITY